MLVFLHLVCGSKQLTVKAVCCACRNFFLSLLYLFWDYLILCTPDYLVLQNPGGNLLDFETSIMDPL